jgi:RHS repeat-associated protein
LEANLLRQEVSRDASTTLTVLTQTFDILGRVCMARNPDSGAKLIWRDVASATLRSWDQPNTTDERSQTFTYDVLRRPLTRSVTANGSTYVAEMTTYGESLVDAKARNARGQAYSHKDGAGIATDEQRDIHGKVTQSNRQLITLLQSKDVPDWSKTVGVDETFTTTTAYDALGRVIQIDTPHNTSVPASQVYPVYNEANLLDKVHVKLRGATTATDIVTNIDYDAKGQRQSIEYGNGSKTSYKYDPLTYRLTQLTTNRPPATATSSILQDLSYTYDPSGNVVQITDAAQATVFYNNQQVDPTARYEYDALYRLTKATGRERITNNASTEPENEGFNSADPLETDQTALRNYSREWSYDQVGNILSLIHTANGGSWNRTYAYAADSNRLASTSVGATTQTYSHNAHGSFTTMPHLDAMDWTDDEHLQHIKRSTTHTWYVYDSAGQRVRKVSEKQGSLTEERIYLGGFEIYRKRQGTTVTLERETLHLMDGNRRIALVETKTVDTSTTLPLPSTVTRYQLDNHLQSATLELDETASVISYEEYYPYGDTSYRSSKSGTEVSEKRYRYTGKEKDEESGLYYHGARYYAAWLGRWTAADPSGMVDGACLYAYVRNHPTGLVDPDGRAGQAPSGWWADSKAGILSAKESIKGAGDNVTNAIMDKSIAASDKLGLRGVARDYVLGQAAGVSALAGAATQFAGEVLMTGPNLMLAGEHAINTTTAGVADLRAGNTGAGIKKIADVTGLVSSAEGVGEGAFDLTQGNYGAAAEKIGGGLANIAGQFLLAKGLAGKLQSKPSSPAAPPAEIPIENTPQTPVNAGRPKVSQTADPVSQVIDDVSSTAKKKPYSNPRSRPKYGRDQVEEVWEAAKDADGKVYDPNTGEELFWDRSQPRTDQWDMGHLKGNKFSELHKKYMAGNISKDEFLQEYRNPNNYRPEHPLSNQGHLFE